MVKDQQIWLPRVVMSLTSFMGAAGMGVAERLGLSQKFRSRSWAMVWLLVVTVGLSACGSSRQMIYVRTGDPKTNIEINGATCILTDERDRRWVVQNTPGRAIIERGGGSITVLCRRDGFQDSIVKLDATLNVVTLLPAAAFGAAGVAVGAGVATGAVVGTGVAAGGLSGSLLGYPRQLNVAMVPGSATPVARSLPAPPSDYNLRQQSQRLEVGRSCLNQIGPYDEYLGPVGPGMEFCR